MPRARNPTRARDEPPVLPEENPLQVMYKNTLSYLVCALEVFFVVMFFFPTTAKYAKLCINMHYFKKSQGSELFFGWGPLDLLTVLVGALNLTVLWLWFRDVVQYFSYGGAKQLELHIAKSFCRIKMVWYVLSIIFGMLILSRTGGLDVRTFWNDFGEFVPVKTKFFFLAQIGFYLAIIAASPAMKIQGYSPQMRFTDSVGLLIFFACSILFRFTNVSTVVLMIRYAVDLIRMFGKDADPNFDDKRVDYNDNSSLRSVYLTLRKAEMAMLVFITVLLGIWYNTSRSNQAVFSFSMFIHSPYLFSYLIRIANPRNGWILPMPPM